jgi:hypothetical protein
VSFTKFALEIGHFDPMTHEIVRPLDAASVQQCLIQAGGQLPEAVWSAEKLQRHRAWVGARRPLLGFLGPEFVSLSADGVLWLCLEYGPNPAALAFLRLMAATGCTIWTESGQPATESEFDILKPTVKTVDRSK